ncbi:hemerythrin domain-containing protein [Bdellovibrio sp. HCB117]|uniref:hemerythrin domain-containing protein n=1 Tax=Bdellovibrio sp. HCB117 TaxID=3394359 RepID=UPI0039B5AABE
MASIYDMLKKDHREVEQLFEKIEDCLDGEEYAEAEHLFDTLKTELTAHAKAEEQVFYEPLKTAAKEKEGEELAWEGGEEHHVMALLLNELSRMDAEEEEWKAKIKVLCEIVEHHVEEEEGEIFPQAKKWFTKEQEQQIAEDMKEMKNKYKTKVEEALEEDIEILMHPLSQKHSHSSSHQRQI